MRTIKYLGSPIQIFNERNQLSKLIVNQVCLDKNNFIKINRFINMKVRNYGKFGLKGAL